MIAGGRVLSDGKPRRRGNHLDNLDKAHLCDSLSEGDCVFKAGRCRGPSGVGAQLPRRRSTKFARLRRTAFRSTPRPRPALTRSR
jgi:hypothetical protein